MVLGYEHLWSACTRVKQGPMHMSHLVLFAFLPRARVTPHQSHFVFKREHKGLSFPTQDEASLVPQSQKH